MEFHFMGPEDMPPGMQSAIQHMLYHHDMSQMDLQDRIHQTQGFLESLNEEGLITFSRIAMTIGEGNGPGSHFAGLAKGILMTKYNLCLCGEKHDMSALGDEAAESPKMPSEQVEKTCEDSPVDEAVELDANYSPEDLVKYHSDLLNEYNMEVAMVHGNPHKFYLRCAGCQTPSPSMKDRMLRDPGVKGCSGCQRKAAWG